MGQRYLIDSNVIIDFTANLLPKIGRDFVKYLINSDFLVSVVVKIEVLGFNDAANKINVLEELIDSAAILPLDDEVTKQTILLRRKNRKLKLGDAIIAATAIAGNLDLVTRNIDDFRNIPGLNIINPWTIISFPS